MLIICFVVCSGFCFFSSFSPVLYYTYTPRQSARTLVCSDFSRCQGEKKSCDVVRFNKEYFILGGWKKTMEEEGRRSRVVS